MTQKKIDDLFTLSSSRSNKRSRINPITTNDRDEFDDIFETSSSAKRKRTNNHTSVVATKKKPTDVFDFGDEPLTSKSTKKNIENEVLVPSLKIKRCISDDDGHKALDDFFNNDTRKIPRRPVKTEESTDILDMFKSRTNPNIPQTIQTSTLENFKTPSCSKNSTTQKKVKMFFDDNDLKSMRETNEQSDIKDYVYVKPVLITGGQWLSKEAETKPTCKMTEPSDNLPVYGTVPDDQRNLMHIQYAALVVDDEYDNQKNSRAPTSTSSMEKSTRKVLEGKSFQKQLIVSDSTIVRKESLQSCYNALLEDLNKPRITSMSSSNKQKKSTFKTSNQNDEIMFSDGEQMDDVDFFDLPNRKKKL